MRMWRFAVITYLRAALKVGILTSPLTPRKLGTCLVEQYERRWIIHVDHFMSKEHFLRYAGRYVRHPPIAQHRFVEISDQSVRFWIKDKRQKRRVEISLAPEKFIALLGEHVLDRYRHAIRYFGLLAPASRSRTFAAMFVLLKQSRRPPPRRLTWAFLRQKDFGLDPLIDSKGQRMTWIKRLPIVDAPTF
jgi:Putative transposase